MRRLLAAEWRKLWIGRGFPGMAVISVALGTLAGIGFVNEAQRQLAAGVIDVRAVTDQLVRSWFLTLLFAALFGAIYVTREFGSGAVGRSVLLSGGRARLFLAKLIAGTGAGALFGLLAAGLAAVSPWVFLAPTDYRPEWTAETSLTLVGVFTVTLLGAPWGVLLGWIIRNQAAAVGVLLGLTLLVDESLLRLVPTIGRFTMTIAMSAVYRDGKPELLPVPVASVVIAGWLVLAGLLGYWLFRTRDVL